MTKQALIGTLVGVALGVCGYATYLLHSRVDTLERGQAQIVQWINARQQPQPQGGPK